MNKKLISIIALLLVIGVCSCAEDPIDESYFDEIYIYYTGHSGDEDTTIRNSPNEFYDDTISKKINIEINGLATSLEYVISLYYPIGEYTIHEYVVEGSDNKIRLNPDMSVYSIGYPFCKINRPVDATADDILPLVQEALSPLVDVSSYHHIMKPEGKIQGSCSLRYYNMIDGYVTDMVDITILKDGSLSYLKIKNLQHEISNLYVDKDLESRMIDFKLERMEPVFGENNEYKPRSFEMSYPPIVEFYNSEIYILYSIGAYYRSKTDKTNEFVSAHVIMIPLRLIEKAK